MTSDELLAAALHLPAAERARLARGLLDSLDGDREEVDEGWAAAWADEIVARLRDAREGRTKLEDGDEVLARIRARWESRPR